MLTYKRKLILNKPQQARIDSWIGACRVVYNLALEIQQAAYRNKGIFVSRYDLMLHLKGLRTIEWMGDLPVQIQEDAITRLDLSYKKFFSGGGFPKWAKKRNSKSITFRQGISIKESKIKLAKIGWLKMFKDSPVDGKVKTATIIKDPTGYFVCITTDATKQIQNKDESQVIGLDMGISSFCIDSRGGFIENPRHIKKYEAKLRIENRSLSRKKKGSNSWKRQAKKLGLLHHKIANARKDFLHKESTRVAKENNLVLIEDLNVRAMSQNRNMSKHIFDCSWGEFRRMLEYKTSVIAINPKYTSQTCNSCGSVDSKSRCSQSEFVCTACGETSHADINAAKNIYSKGIAIVRQREALACALGKEIV